MISNEQAERLIAMRKKVIVNGELKENIIIDQKFPMLIKFELMSEDDNRFTFMWQIRQSSKNTVKISLHCQDNNSKFGLFRVDYNAGHINPTEVCEDLPQQFFPYIGKHFSETEHHVHYHVAGYKTLAWAVPIEDTQIQRRELRQDNLWNDLADAIQEFARLINLSTTIQINRILL